MLRLRAYSKTQEGFDFSLHFHRRLFGDSRLFAGAWLGGIGKSVRFH
jgi:hypothetical protein